MSERQRVAFYGAGHLGRQIYHHVAAHHAERMEMLGFIDDTRPAGEVIIDGKLTLGSLASAANSHELGPVAIALVFAIGYAHMGRRRAALQRALDAGYRLHSVIHPRASSPARSSVTAASCWPTP